MCRVSGEKPEIREAMKENVRDLVRSGVPHDRAQQLAREAAIRADRNVRGEGNPPRKR